MTEGTFFAIFMVIGLLLIIGGMSTSHPRVAGNGLILLLSFFAGLLGSNGIWDFVGYFGILLAITRLLSDLILWLIERKASAATEKGVIGATALDKFFVECVITNIDDFSSPKKKQQAEILAAKYGLKYPNGIEALYQQGLAAHANITKQMEINHVETIRAREAELFFKLNQYADQTGRNKRTKILNDRAAELQTYAKFTETAASNYLHQGQQKEHNWALMGGLADGIAGFAAGVSVAAEFQLENMNIRAQNQARLQQQLPGYMRISDSASQTRKNAEALVQESANVKLKMIHEGSPAELLKNITFKNEKVEISETGAALVTVVASLKEGFKIFDDVPAVVEGTIIAKIYDSDVLCGTAQLVLPLYGLGQNIPLNGISIGNYQPDKKYTVEFTATNLWALEA